MNQKQNLEQAEEMLFEEMEYAAELLQNREDFGRSGVLHAVHACYSFLHVRGLSGQALKPLYDVVTAFEDVEEGTCPNFSTTRSSAVMYQNGSGLGRMRPARSSYMPPPAWRR